MPYGIFFSPFRAFVLWLIKIFLRNLRKGVDNAISVCYTNYRNSRKRGFTMKMLTVVFNDDKEYEQLKKDAYKHEMNISSYIRYLVAKERKEREK